MRRPNLRAAAAELARLPPNTGSYGRPQSNAEPQKQDLPTATVAVLRFANCSAAGADRGRGSRAGALRWQGQIAMATRGRDLHLNVPLPRKPPDLLMAESPPMGGLSAFNELQSTPDQGRMSFSVAVNRSPDSSSSPSMCRRAGPVSVHRSRK